MLSLVDEFWKRDVFTAAVKFDFDSNNTNVRLAGATLQWCCLKTCPPTHWTSTGRFTYRWCCTFLCWAWTTIGRWFTSTANNCYSTCCWYWPITRINWLSPKYYWTVTRCRWTLVCPRHRYQFPGTTSQVKSKFY